jgi:hypothetical protein
MLILQFFLGVPALALGLILYGFVAANRRSYIEQKQTQITRRRYAIVLLSMLVGAAVVGLEYKVILAQGQQLAQSWQLYQPLVARLLKTPSQATWQAFSPAIAVLWPQLRALWLMLLPLASCVAIYLESTRVKTLVELRLEKEQQVEARDRTQRRAAAQKVKGAPEQLKGKPIIGLPLGGALSDWRIKDSVTYPAELLNRHAVIIGGSGTGKTEFLLRVAYLTAKVLKWKVFYIDAKGDVEVSNRFMATMAHAGVRGAAMFPDLAYHGWRGDATAILNRLMAIEDYSEPYYRAIAKTVLTLACHAPGGPPCSSIDLLDRLHLDTLAELYADSDDPRAQTLKTLTEIDFAGVYKRYFGFFDAIGRKLDGSWSFDTVDAGYVLLDGLALKEEARSLGRYLMEDFAHYVSKRKKADQRVLLIMDEFSAISRGGADAANLFERVRSYGAGVVVTSQSYEGLGADAARLVGAAWATIAFQCTDPEPIAARAGTVREVQSSLQTELTAVPGRNTLISASEHLTGTTTQREQEVFRLHPNVIRSLGIGECCIITNGDYMRLRVARLPEMPDMGMMWGRAPQSSGGPPGRSQAAPKSGSDKGPATLDPEFVAADEPAEELDLVRSEVRPSAPTDGLLSVGLWGAWTDTGDSGTGEQEIAGESAGLQSETFYDLDVDLPGLGAEQAFDEPQADGVSLSEELDI